MAFIKDINNWYARGNRPLRIEDCNKNVEVKKSLPFSSINYTSEQSFQPGLSNPLPNKKNSRLCQGGNYQQ